MMSTTCSDFACFCERECPEKKEFPRYNTSVVFLSPVNLSLFKAKKFPATFKTFGLILLKISFLSSFTSCGRAFPQMLPSGSKKLSEVRAIK